jgi:hypothetical protein
MDSEASGVVPPLSSLALLPEQPAKASRSDRKKILFICLFFIIPD